MFNSFDIMKTEMYALKFKIKLFNDSWMKQQYLFIDLKNLTATDENIKQYDYVLNDQLNDIWDLITDSLIIDNINM